MIEALRTPDEAFAGLQDYDFAPHYISDFAGYKGLRLHYVDEGPKDAPVFLCLHGEPSWSYLYRKMIKVFVNHGYRVVAPDLYGFGKSDKPVNDAVYSFDFHRNALLGFIDTLDLKDATLVCQDWGGVLGLTLPMEMPERFKRLLIMNTGLMVGAVQSEAFLSWKADIVSNPDVDVAFIMQKYEPAITPEIAKAYAAPFPDQSYKAGVRTFPTLVAPVDDFPGVEISRKAAKFWSEDWDGESFMAIGMQDDMLGPEVMYMMKDVIRNCPEPMEIPEARHFVQEHGERIAEAALRHFNMAKGDA